MGHERDQTEAQDEADGGGARGVGGEMASDLFIFLNRRANQVRISFWDRDGCAIMMKRIEEGTFRGVKTAEGKDLVELDAGELAMVLEGIDAPTIKRRRRYRAPEQSSYAPTSSLHS
ncbi:MAG: IS66 family insertion sequence element accessory protein TnpB [Nannocystaceae bacterium]